MKNSASNSRKSATRSGTITRLPRKRTPAASPAEILNAEGVDLSHVMSELAQTSAVNASRVVKLHDRIAAGEYKIDAERVAQKMLDFDASLDD